ncbi:MAG: pilus assembly protein TadG-related protein [Bacillota bacterium]|nr:pilus assembly protein TadG-related protein [Bacillota bacterium]
MVRRILRDEAGAAVITLYMAMLLLVFGVLACDYARAFAVRSRLQTACDAASLAAAMTAAPVPEYSYTVIRDGSGQVVAVQENIDGWHAEIRDPAAARLVADGAFQKNTGFAEAPVTDREGEVVWRAYPDRYRYAARADVKMFLLGGPLARWIAGAPDGRLPVAAGGTAQAVVEERP